MSASQAASSMKVPPGFHVTVFASEPEVQNPIAMTWDARGRLWVAENYTYAERTLQFDRSLQDRVLVLEDSDGDGIADRRTVFIDSVQILGGIEVGMGGVWLICPPELLFVPDADGDGVADGPAETVLDGFRLAEHNYHTFANGLKFGPDGWLYGRCGSASPGALGLPGSGPEERVRMEGAIWRYHPTRKCVEVLTTGTTNPWGHDWNAEGEMFFVNTVNAHLWHMIPGAHFARGSSSDPNSFVYELIDSHADHWHFDTGEKWTASRDGAANAFGGGHAHCGTMIYQEQRWPEAYHHSLFTLNLHGRRVNRESLKRVGSGFVASHSPDFMVTEDPFFRGLDICAGPDGNAFVADWSDTGECHESTGVHRTSGRIFRICYGPAVPVVAECDLRQIPEPALVDYAIGNREWYRRQASLELQRRANVDGLTPATIRSLENLTRWSKDATAARAMMTLNASGQLSQAFAVLMLNHEIESVRCWALRSLTDHCAIDDAYGRRNTAVQLDPSLLAVLVETASSDQSGLVRLTMASLLQRLPVSQRVPLAAALVAQEQDSNDHNLPLMVWYGLISVASEQPEQLVELAMVAKWPKLQQFIARRLAGEIDRQPSVVDELLRRSASCPDLETRLAVLRGLVDGLNGWRKANKPKSWEVYIESLRDDQGRETDDLVRELAVVFGEGRALEQVRELAMNKMADVESRRSALQTLINQRPDDLRQLCLSLLPDSQLNVMAAQGLALNADAQSAQALVNAYPKFRARRRPELVYILTQGTSLAHALLDAMEAGKIPVSDLTPSDAWQILSLGDDELTQRLSAIWGEVRESPEERQEQMQQLKETLGSLEMRSSPNLGNGRIVFQQLCGKCHKLYGLGESIGPDLTGSGRHNLDYLIENIVDPSSVVGVAYRLSLVCLEDGRILSGVIISRNEKTLTLQTAVDVVVIASDEVESIRPSNRSPMPEGLLSHLTNEQIRDLFAYLQHPFQVPLP